MPESSGAEDEPVSLEEARRLFEPLRHYPKLAIAVSGGSDSTALMWLVARWAKGNGPSLTVLTVDHGLRAESAAEARAVKAAAAERLGLPARILAWRGAKPEAGLQAAAREARYGLMSRWCEKHGVPALLTGHTLDDQAETFLMRLSRGSGLNGLSSIGEGRWGLTLILRPLLGVSRDRLRATLSAQGVGWIEDPSNEDHRFERVRWRKALARLADEGLTAAAIARSAERLGRARLAIEAETNALLGRAVVSESEDRVEIDLPIYAEAPEEMRIRLLQALLQRIGSQSPELSAIERLAAWLESGQGTARTLGGCRVGRRAGRIVIAREGPRRSG